MRKLAISMIRRYGTSDDSVYPLLSRSYTEGTDVNEKLDSIAALSALGTESASASLAGFISVIHQRRQSNSITALDEQLVRSLIPALGATGQRNGRQILLLIQNSPAWTNTVRRLAADAVKQLN
jgi:hypothetical protein